MRLLDWVVFFAWLLSLVGYGLYRGRGSRTVDAFLRAGKTMPWYAMGLSILATQASAITFISTTGQGFVDGMRFVQFYFGLPIAMVILCATAVPIFHRANVYTAYEYLERRFDAKTRALVSVVFLIQRGLAAGIGLYAPAVALATVLGWPDRLVTVIIGVLVVLYTSSGGIKALTWTDVQQMTMIFVALIMSTVVIVRAMPSEVGLAGALKLAGAVGRLRIIDTHLDWSNRYNLWSGLLGGGFLALAYFGTDQSQVQRYLTGKSIAQSRLSLLFNATVKIPMQLFILSIGALVFALSMFVPAPIVFQPAEAANLQRSASWSSLNQQYQQTFKARREEAYRLIRGTGSNSALRGAQKRFEASREEALHTAGRLHGANRLDDTNYIFLSFVRNYLPVGLVGLVIGVIFSASMGSTSGEINSLATVSVIDIYRRHLMRNGSDRHYLIASRLLTIFWGAFAVGFAAFGSRGFGALIERVNIVGSLFYGGMLGVFVLAFLFPRVHGTAAFIGVLAGEAAIFAAAYFTSLSFLWYNVLGCLVVLVTGLTVEWIIAAGPGSALRQPDRSALQ